MIQQYKQAIAYDKLDSNNKREENECPQKRKEGGKERRE
jgi:hypothetical protein